MGKVLVAAFGVSLDGFGAGPEQNLENPLGQCGEELHQWFVPTRTFQSTHGGTGGTTGIDDDIAAKSLENLGAWILGRNMFGPIRGDWGDKAWRGWWGDNPPYHVPVFVLTHHEREPLDMEGGTTFHFVTRGIEEALEQAQKAANGRDVRIGGGVSTIRQYLRARLIDELHLAFVPILLGRGENLFEGLDLPEFGYRVADRLEGEAATHIFIGRS
jgi:dihydrofolate reductase